jgi:hypothetical protein
MDKMRQELRQRVGEVQVAVDLIRETRDAQREASEVLAADDRLKSLA